MSESDLADLLDEGNSNPVSLIPKGKPFLELIKKANKQDDVIENSNNEIKFQFGNNNNNSLIKNNTLLKSMNSNFSDSVGYVPNLNAQNSLTNNLGFGKKNTNNYNNNINIITEKSENNLKNFEDNSNNNFNNDNNNNFNNNINNNINNNNINNNNN